MPILSGFLPPFQIPSREERSVLLRSASGGDVENIICRKVAAGAVYRQACNDSWQKGAAAARR
jgi:hypothetical protein